MTGSSVGKSRSVRAQQLIFVEIDGWTRSARLTPANTDWLDVVDHAAARRPRDGDRGRVQTALVSSVSVAQRFTSI